MKKFQNKRPNGGMRYNYKFFSLVASEDQITFELLDMIRSFNNKINIVLKQERDFKKGKNQIINDSNILWNEVSHLASTRLSTCMLNFLYSKSLDWNTVTLSELSKYSVADFLKTRNLGRNTLEELMQILKRNNFELSKSKSKSHSWNLEKDQIDRFFERN